MLRDNLERQGIDLSVDDTLLYLDVTNKSIGINTSATDAQTALNVNSSFKTTDLIANALKLPTLTINTPNANTISSTTGNLYLNALGSIISPNIRTDDLNFNDNIISSTTTNQSIELRPHGVGTVEIPTNLNVTGDIYASGDILIDGTIVFGNNSSQDQVNIAAGVNSNFLPTQDTFYSLGEDPATGGNRWLNTYANLLNGQTITTDVFESGSVNLTLRPGKLWYVSVNGNDANYGDHEANTFLTIKKALLSASAGDEILIYPGTYTEILPLTVPAGVTVRGTGIRSVTIVPTVGTNNKDVFLLNGETTINDLTVKDFYYSSSADTGYAFRFASDIKVTTRSPYIQNVSIITKETMVNAHDAGRGALVDGAVANTSTKEASMLFQSVTMITPNADALTMTNGVRVEWLNCFTYFANISLHATTGIGRYDANLGVTRYGAEVRSIGSATVYGIYGAYADGPNTLIYLVDYNFAYVGAGTDVVNDPSVNNQTNEVIEIGGGRVYYQSLDNRGTFRVGDAFSVDHATGDVTFNGVGVTAQGASSINFATAGSETKINSTLVSTGNIKFNGNTISSTYGDVNLVSNTDNLNLTQNILANKDISVGNNFSVKGTLTLGDQLVDMTEFKADTSSDILPSADRRFSLGNDTFVTGLGEPLILPGKRWNKIINQLSVIDSNIQIFDNIIQTTLSNADLELRTHGSGKILFENNELLISNQLTVNGTSTTKNVNITGYIHQTGSTTQTGNRNVSNGIGLTGNISATVQAAFETITVSAGQIATTASNADLELYAAGSGQVLVPVADVQIQNNLNALGITTVGNASITDTLSLPRLNDSDIVIFDNQIATTGLNHNLLLKAHSTGKVIGVSNVEITNNLKVDGLSTLANTVINGAITHTGASNQTGNTIQTGNYNLSRNLTVTQAAYFNNINIVNNQITTVNTNSDLELRAAGTGKVLVNDNLTITNNLRVVGTTTTNGITNSGTITADTFTEGNIVITQNYIATTVGNDNLILSPNLSGKVSAASNSVLISNDLAVTGTSTLGNTVIGNALAPVLLTHIGTSNQTGNSNQTGDYTLSNNLTVTQAAYFNNVDIVNNIISTSDTNADLELRAAGTGRVVIDDVFRVAANLQVDGSTTTAGITNSGTITSDRFSDGTIVFKDNYITTLGNVDLVLRATKDIHLAYDPLLIDHELKVSGATSIKNLVIANELLTGNKTQTGNVVQTGNFSISNNLTVTDTSAFFAEMSIVNNVITTTASNADLELRAAGSGVVRVGYDNVAITNQLRVNGTTATTTINNSGTVYSDMFTNGNLIISQNYITSQPSTNIKLVAAGLGNVTLPKITFDANSIKATALNDNIELTVGAGSAIISATNALKIPSGTTAARSTNNIGDIRLNTSDTLFSGWNGARVTFGGLFSTDRRTTVLAHPTNNSINFVANNTTAMTLTSAGLNLNSMLVNNNLQFSGNTISSTSVGSDIVLTPDNAGQLKLGNIEFNTNNIQNEDPTSAIVVQNTGYGYVQFGGAGGIGIPAGDEASRPTNPVLGDFRFNTNLSVAEVFNGIEYVSLGGGNVALLNAAEIAAITDLWGLILG
jgi:hypothetical protein